MKKYSGVLLMVVLALACLGLQYSLGWQAFVTEEAAHGQVAEVAQFRISWARDVFENLQSEAFQLALQFLLLAGALKVFGIVAYEKDQEEIKGRLGRIEERLVARDVLAIGGE